MNCERSAEVVSEVIADFLRRKALSKDNVAWALQKSPLGGMGVFATRDIECGEEIFRDFPVIDGPRTKPAESLFCVACYKQNDVKLCSKKCGLPICSDLCQQNHQSECEFIRRKRNNMEELDMELFRNLAPLRSLLVCEDDKKVIKQLKHHKGPNHGKEIDRLKDIGLEFEESEEKFTRFVCCVMDANAFEVLIENDEGESNFRGLYPLAGLVNHSCVPNLIHAFDRNKIMIVRSCTPIRKNQELFHSYVRLVWSTPTRQFNLVQTKHFTCKCSRCVDPTEFGTYMTAILCEKCKGNVLPQNPLSLKSVWVCEDCRTEIGKLEIAKVLGTLGSVLRSFDDDDLEIMLKFLNLKLAKLVHSNHEIAVELKYRMIGIIGHHQKYKWRDIDTQLLEIKTNLCRDLLKLIEELKLGENKLKGFLSYEMYCCLKEKQRRDFAVNTTHFAQGLTGQAEKYLKAACSILKEDVTSSREVRI